MGFANKLIGWVSGNGAEVDAGNNLKTTTPKVNQRLGGETAAPNYVGDIAVHYEQDSGSLTGARKLASPRVSADKRLSVGLDTVDLHHMFSGSAQNTAIWKHLFTTMTATQIGDGFLNLNANLTATTTTGCSIQSWKYFSLFGASNLLFNMTVGIFNGNPVANQVIEWGLAVPTGTAAPVDGVYFRYTTAGLVGYIKFGANAEVPSATLLAAGALTVGNSYVFQILINERFAEFYMSGVFLGSIAIPTVTSNLFQQIALPIFAQQRNSGAVSGTQAQAKISGTSLTRQDLDTGKPWAHQLAGMGMSNQGLEGGTMGSLAIYSNAAIAAAAALTNTTAAAPNTGLGGAVLVLPTLTAGTDGILFAYQNPVGGLTQPGRVLYVNGVHLDASVQTVLVGGPLNLAMGIAYGSTAVSLATTESTSFTNNTIKAARRVVLGVLNFIAAAAAGTDAKDIYRQFTSPIVVNPGEWFVITCRNLGTVTTTGALIMTATVDHYFE